MKVISIVGAFIGSVVLILLLTWAIQGNDFFMYQYFGPRYEQTRREIFEQSKAYNQGMQQELSNMQFEYYKASPEHKQALASIILHRAADFDETRLTPDLRAFITQLKRERTQP
jgi:hypothetical protein